MVGISDNQIDKNRKETTNQIYHCDFDNINIYSSSSKVSVIVKAPEKIPS